MTVSQEDLNTKYRREVYTERREVTDDFQTNIYFNIDLTDSSAHQSGTVVIKLVLGVFKASWDMKVEQFVVFANYLYRKFGTPSFKVRG